MDQTKELFPFEQDKTFKDLGLTKSIFDKHENYVYYARAITDEEKEIAINGFIWHCVRLIKARDIKNWRTEHFIMPGERYNILREKLNEKYRNKQWFIKKKYDKTDYYHIQATAWNNAFVFRVFKLHINVTKENKTLFFNESARIIVKDKDIYIEDKNKISKVGLGLFLNPKNNLPYIDKHANISIEEYNQLIEKVFNKEIQIRLRLIQSKVYKQCYAFSYNDEQTLDLSGITMRTFFWAYGKVRQNTIPFKKEIPKAITNTLSSPVTTLPDGVHVANNDDFMVFTYIKNGFELEKIFLSHNHTYIFDRNPFDNEWSMSRKELTIYKVKASDYWTNNTKDLRKVKKVFNEGLKMHTSGRYIPRCSKTDRPLVQLFSAQKSVVAEQALKYGFYNASNKTVKRKNTNVFADTNAKNISEFFGVPGKWLNFINKELSFQAMEIMLDDISHYKQDDSMQNIDIKDVISLGFYDYPMIRTINHIYRENGKNFGKVFHKLVNKYDASRVSHILFLINDYTRQREDALAYIENHNINCKLPPIVKISHLQYYHDRATLFSRNHRREMQLQQNQILQDKLKKYVNSKHYRNRLYDDNKYAIITPQTAMDMEQEGAILHHCVGSYVPRVANEECEIYFMRKTNDMQKPFLTIEVKNNILKQCYGYRDSYNSDKNAEKFIRKWCEQNKLLIDCTIYDENTHET